MNKVLSLLIGFFIVQLAYSQKYFEIIDNDSTELNQERAEMHIDFLRDVDFEFVADIGSGNMTFILQLADYFNDKSFVFEDIDSSTCNWANLKSKIEFLELNKVDTNKLSIQIGESSTTLLSGNTYDLVIIAGLLHELEDPGLLMTDVKRILKNDGKVLISDAIYHQKPNPHPSCSHPYLTKTEFEDTIANLPLTIIKDWKRTGIKSRSNGEYESRIVLCTFE